jgi:CheY-like chemotaxis protein
MAGFHTAVANHGDECLELLRKGGNQYDIILMDLEMPIKSGFEAATEIRARENAGELEGRTPIIAVTGNARNEYIDRGISNVLRRKLMKASEIGIDGFIVKPYEKAILIEKIRSLV